jgi:aspartate/glutamate racemase
MHVSVSEAASAEWVDRVIQENNIRQNGDSAKTYITLQLSVHKAAYYQKLQLRIASLIPDESRRPCIFLELQGSKAAAAAGGGGGGAGAADASSAPGAVAILGGMGPLSDASLLLNVISKLTGTDTDTHIGTHTDTTHTHTAGATMCARDYPIAIDMESVRIHLLSAPPPRTLGRMLTNLWAYCMNVRVFLQMPYSCIFLASNTAHVFHSVLNYYGCGNVRNLCETVGAEASALVSASTISTIRGSDEEVNLNAKEGNSNANTGVLILGTKLARSNSLYDYYLAAHNLECINVTDEQAGLIQNEINAAKAGGGATDVVPRIIESILTRCNGCGADPTGLHRAAPGSAANMRG